MPGSEKRVLVIDDDSLARSILRLVFKAEGYQCQVAENGAMGLAMLDQFQPDLVVTDHHMPVLTGLEFLELLHKKNRRNVPAVILITCDSNHDLKTRALQSGARAVLEKPFDMDEIRSLANWLLHSEESIAVGATVVN
ncbi:MAG: response regulator [Nitrospirales bacterium]|nr:response regulator [Nitrospira sp.]MDR4500744.1 response regulator [Nitrospirales bacterium]